MRIMSERQQRGFGSNRNIVPGPNRIVTSIEKASEVDDIVFAEKNFSAIEETDIQLDRGSFPEPAEVMAKKETASGPRRDSAHAAVVDIAQQTSAVEPQRARGRALNTGFFGKNR